MKTQIEVVEEPTRLELYMQNFMERHKDIGSNDLTLKAAANDFVNEIKDTLPKENLLEGIPMKVSTINRTKEGKIVAQFEAWHGPSGYEYLNGIDYICADIIGVVPDSMSTKLKQGDNDYYVIRGQLIDFITYEMACLLIEKEIVTLTNKLDFGKSALSQSYDNNYVLDFGIMYYQIDGIYRFEGRKQVE